MLIVGFNNFVEIPNVLHLNLDAEMLVVKEKVAIKNNSITDEVEDLINHFIMGCFFRNRVICIA